MSLQTSVRRYLLVAAALLVAGAMGLTYALLVGPLGTVLDRKILAVLGGALMLVGGWQLWTLAITQYRADRRAGALQDQLAMMAAVAQHTGNPVIVTGPGRGVVWVNESFTRVTGYSSTEALGRNPAELVRSPLADPAELARLDEAIRNQAGIDIEVLHRYKDGRDRWVRLLLSPRQDVDEGFVSVLVDIDEQVLTREALRAALRDNETLMHTLDAHALVSETDRHGTITRVNRQFVESSGYSEAELLGSNHRILSSGRHSPGFWAELWTTVRHGQPWSGEICNRAKNGELYWVQSLITPFLGADGQIERYVSIRLDVTATRRAEEELQTSRELLAQTSRIAGVGGWYTDLRSGALHLSAECRQVLGLDPGASLALSEVWNLFDDSGRQNAREQLRALGRFERAEVDFVAPLQVPPGQAMRWVRLVAAVDLEHRQTERVIGAVLDITDQVRARQRIEEEQRILHSAIDAVGEAFALYDRDNRLVYFNDEYATLYPLKDELQPGMSYREILERVAYAGLYADALGREQEWISQILERHRVSQPDDILQMSDGRWIRLVDRVTSDGYRVVFRHDVTALHKATLAADAAARSKSQFLANMSHEIRTPINAVLGLLQLLGYTALDERQRELADKARTATRSLLAILNDILDFSKVEAGKMELHPEPFELAGLLRELRVILEGALDGKPVALVYEVDPVIPAVLVGDALRLKQVLINLGGNAIKFTAEGRVTLRLQYLGQAQGRVRVRLAVEDTGIGIGPEQQRHIFSGFSQAEASTARRFGGTGLGLAISQRLVALMGGEISLRSAPGAGSTFSFELDLAVAETARLPSPAAASVPAGPRLAGLRLLLVEDNALNQEVAQVMLEREGARVVLASDGRQAVERLAREPRDCDLVLMDMQMPVLDGLQATREIRERPQLHALPILAMTANALPSDRALCAAAGMNGHIGKPFDLDELVALIRHWTGRGEVVVSAALEPVTPPVPVVLEDEAPLRRLGGDAVLLARLRASLVRGLPAQLAELRAAEQRQDWPRAAGLAHQLKSSSAAVGAQRLSRACAGAEQLWRPLPAGQVADASAGAALEPLLASAAAVQACLQPADTSARAVGFDHGDALRGDLLQLRRLLEQADMEAVELYEQMSARWPQLQHEPGRELQDCMDLPAAARAVGVLLDQYPNVGA